MDPKADELGFFARCEDLVGRFQRGAIEAELHGSVDTAAKFQRVALLLEELRRRDATEALTIGEAALMTPLELRSTRLSIEMSVIDFAARLGIPASDLDEMEAGTRMIPARFDSNLPS